MFKTALMLALGFFSCNTLAENYDAFVGTMRVNFQPLSHGGVAYGCSLLFNSINLDYAYKQGKPVQGVGNFSYMVTSPTQFGMSLKLGVSDVLDGKNKVEAPFFAYIKTPNGTTGGMKNISNDSDTKGFRMFVPVVNESSMAVLFDLVDGKNAEIGFNRKKDGMDAMLPLDLTVEDTVADSEGLLKRQHSRLAIDGFNKCVLELSSKLDFNKSKK